MVLTASARMSAAIPGGSGFRRHDAIIAQSPQSPQESATMSSAPSMPEPRRKFTVEEYLALERAAEERHEYLDGAVIAMDRDDTAAMAGETLPHGIISANIIISL